MSPIFPGKSAKEGAKGEGGMTRLKPGLSDRLAGETATFRANLSPHLPMELVGGSIPHIVGTEDEAVWNAASQALGTERVHYCYSADGGKLWYLACPSATMASNPDSWCPLAAALPGNSEFWDKETVYLYEQEGIASALRWEPETGRMQIFLGAARTILPRIQSMDANFVTVNPAVAVTVPWRNRSLRTERLSRAAARTLFLSGLALCLVFVLVLGGQFVAQSFVRRDLDKVRADTQKASQDLMIKAYNALQSDTIKHMVRLQELLDNLRKVDGTLVRYEVKGEKVEWEALVPAAYQQGVGPIKGTVQPGLEKDGRVRIKGTK